MLCKACNRVPQSSETEDCFEKAIDIIKQHYKFYKTALEKRDLELLQIKDRNEKLNKALQLLQENQLSQQQQQPAKRFKSQHSDNSWLGGNHSSQEERVTSDLSLTDDEPMGASNLNMALNSEQLFETSVLSQTKNDVSLTTSSELVPSPRVKDSPKRNKQRDTMRCLKDRNKCLARSKSEWHTKDRNSPAEKSWAMKFLQPELRIKSSEDKTNVESKKSSMDKRLCLSLRKPNPSKVKQSLLNFNKSKDGSFREDNRLPLSLNKLNVGKTQLLQKFLNDIQCQILNESEVGEDIIDASPVIVNKNSRAGRSWAHRSGHNLSNNTNNSSSNTTTKPTVNVTINKKDDNNEDDKNKTLDDIVFDFSPSKKPDSTLVLNSSKDIQPKQLKFDNYISTDCTALPNDPMGISTIKSDTSSVVILTPNTQDIIFVDDTSDFEQEIDTMDLMASTDNLEKLKEYESKYIQKQQQNKDLEQFKKPQDKLQTNADVKPLNKIKPEKITQELKTAPDLNSNQEEKPSCSTSIKPRNPLLDELDTDDEEDFMPKPFIINQEKETLNKIKPEKITQELKTAPDLNSNQEEKPSCSTSIKPRNPLLDELDTDDEEDFMPKPFIIKQEKETNQTANKLSIKQRFNIDCEECEKLINFLDKGLTDAQIQLHLEKSHQRHYNDIMRQNTPKDFWNPFILSFQADDPRNEILIDNRFKDKK